MQNSVNFMAGVTGDLYDISGHGNHNSIMIMRYTGN